MDRNPLQGLTDQINRERKFRKLAWALAKPALKEK